MKSSIAFFVATVIGLTGSAGYAAGWNVDIFTGKQGSDNLEWAGSDYKTDSGRSYGLGVSKRLSPRTSVGFEVGYTKNQYSSFRPNYLSGTSAIITAKYDFLKYNRFEAYAGLGLGAVRASYRNYGFNHQHRDTVAAGQLTLGALVAVSPRSRLFLEARHINAFNDPKVSHNGGTGSLEGAEYKGNSLVLGWRYSF